MRLLPCSAALLTAALVGPAAPAQAKRLLPASPPLTTRAVQADVVLVGQVVEVEKDPVEGPAYAGAPKDQKATYRVAVVKIGERLIGAGGLTQVRVGYLPDGPAVPPAAAGRLPRRPIDPGVPVAALTAGFEGCFLLDRLPGADFYVLSGWGPPLDKKDEAFAKQLEAVRAVARAVEDPGSALKAKDLGDRFRAAHALLRRYHHGWTRWRDREPGTPVPAEERQLLLDLMLELPWLPKADAAPAVAGEPPPSRSALWPLIRPNDLGFRPPKAAPGEDYHKLMDEATAAFLKANRDRIRIAKYEK